MSRERRVAQSMIPTACAAQLRRSACGSRLAAPSHIRAGAFQDTRNPRHRSAPGLPPEAVPEPLRYRQPVKRVMGLLPERGHLWVLAQEHSV